MSSSSTLFGVLPNGSEVSLIELRSDSLTVKLTNYGGRIISVIKDGIDLVHGPKSFEDMLADTAYCGALCGRVANRIAGGKFSLGENEYSLAINNGPNHLHGGLEGFDSKVWTVDLLDDYSLSLSYVSPSGEEGYPGDLTVRAVYSLVDNTLILALEAEVEGEPTIINLTNHVYWNLDGEGTVDAHHLIATTASAYTPMDETNVPTGVIMPVEGTSYDLREEVSLKGKVFDDNMVLPTQGTDAEELPVAALLMSEKTGIQMIMATDMPGLQVYTGDYLPTPRGGIALEPQDFPDAVHKPHFPCIVLHPDEMYMQMIEWTID